MASEIRRNPITKKYVVIATDRGNRPFDFKDDSVANDDSPEECPFCPGHEGKTPPTIWAYGTPTNWTERVFANKFGAFKIEGKLEKRRRGLFRLMNARGAHEVIVATPRHAGLYTLTDEEATRTLIACRERINDLKLAREENNGDKPGDLLLAYIIVFGNEGRDAAASKKHGHFQLIGLPIIPGDLWEEYRRAEEYWEDENTCLFCDLVKQERAEGERVVTENDVFLSVCAYAPRVPFETWLLPKSHLPIFEDGNERTMTALAEVLMNTLRRMDKALHGVAFNLYLKNTPLFDRNHDRRVDFRIEIVPRLTKPAGFEFGTGVYINPVPPETAAQTLRDAG